uniref:Putative secreted protein n=1 Tax=Anopheles darlingi TaxID=43151 RepID=A0A2M4DB88_ANODA
MMSHGLWVFVLLAKCGCGCGSRSLKTLCHHRPSITVRLGVALNGLFPSVFVFSVSPSFSGRYEEVYDGFRFFFPVEGSYEGMGKM